MKKLLACALVAMAGCPDVSVDPDETAGPVVEFDPARSLATGARYIPFPNDLARDPATGKLNLGPQACENATAKATRENILNKLDGFGAYQTAMQVTFSAEVDEASLADNIVMYQLTNGGQPNDPANAVSIPVVIRKGTTLRFIDNDHCTSPETVNAVAIIPMIPLQQKSTYFVSVNKGIKDTTGKEFTGTFTWGLVAASQDPVKVDEHGVIVGNRTPLDPADEAQRAQLLALDGLWKLHASGLAFVTAVPNARPRTDVLVGFQFTTQTTTDPLDQSVTGSPANLLPSAGLLQVQSVTSKFGPYAGICANSTGVPPNAPPESNPTQCFLKLALGGCSPLTTGCGQANFDAGSGICQSLGCAAVGDVLGGGLGELGFQTMGPNPLPNGAMIPGAWSDPVHPEMQTSLTLETLITIPATAAPANGYPTVIFGHGLGSSKEAMLAISSSLASRGFAAVAIDFSAHGSRAVRTSKEPALGCMGTCALGGVPNTTRCDTIAECGMNETCGVAGMSETVPPAPTTAPQCYAPFLSTDLASTRDGIRQTVLDIQRLAKALKTCGAAGCGNLKVDPSKIYYVGQSLGSLIGTTAVGTAPEIKDAVLNVGGVGWADVLENTQTLQIRCTLIDSLIDAGILMGEHWNGSTNAPTGLCSTDAWKAQPGYQTFSATLRWVIDPADGANFAKFTAQKRVLIQEVVNDQVVPNVATDRMGAIFGLTPANGDVFAPPGATAPSMAITTNPNSNKFVKYPEVPGNATTMFPGNTFEHASLLRPAAGAAGALGTVRLQTDAITFLLLNP